MISPRRLYLNGDKSKIVEHGDPDAAFLLVGKGGEIDDRMERRHKVLAYLKENPQEAPCPVDTGANLKVSLPESAIARKPEAPKPEGKAPKPEAKGK